MPGMRVSAVKLRPWWL